MNVRPRSYGFALVTVVLVVVVVWVGRHTWQELRQLHRGFTSAQTEDVYISRHIEASVRELNEVLLRIHLRRNSADEAKYQKICGDLNQWIRAHKDALSTPEQCELINQVATAFETCSSRNARLLEERMQSGTAASLVPVLELVESNAAPVLDLCRTLEASERAEQTQFMDDSQRALAWVQELLAVMLLLLIILAGTAVVAINRGVIDPLRLKLIETRALAARNEKLAALGTLAAGVAHEIRNPLTAINVRLHSLKKNLAANSSEQEDAVVIDHEIQRLERIVQGFLQFARPAEPKLLAVSADGLLAKVQSLFSSQLAKTSIELKVESVPDIWVRADPHQIEQVLINLIQNAAESMERGGTITLRARIGKGRLNGNTCPVVMLEVSDTGKGIPPEVKQRMFDPFFTTKEEGTGLGLAISLRIVEKHGGTLECRSEVNRGTTFSILLPHTKPEENNEFTT
jgi:signal transduction histidine kinase